MPDLTDLMIQIREILEEERELNSNDPLVCSLLTRIENRIAECVKDGEEEPKL
jgi:hypothetical protein